MVVSFNLAVDVVVVFPFSSAFAVPSWHLTLTPLYSGLYSPLLCGQSMSANSDRCHILRGLNLICYHVGVQADNNDRERVGVALELHNRMNKHKRTGAMMMTQSLVVLELEVWL